MWLLQRDPHRERSEVTAVRPWPGRGARLTSKTEPAIAMLSRVSETDSVANRESVTILRRCSRGPSASTFRRPCRSLLCPRRCGACSPPQPSAVQNPSCGPRTPRVSPTARRKQEQEQENEPEQEWGREREWERERERGQEPEEEEEPEPEPEQEPEPWSAHVDRDAADAGEGVGRVPGVHAQVLRVHVDGVAARLDGAAGRRAELENICAARGQQRHCRWLWGRGGVGSQFRVSSMPVSTSCCMCGAWISL